MIVPYIIKNTLVKLKPDAKDEFEKNYETLKTELQKLDEEFHQIAITALSPTDELSQRDLEKIIDMAQDKQMKYILFEKM